jgi:hypothetical protein
MPYPAAPWTLNGYALQTLQWVDVSTVRPLIPPEFKIISIFPNQTLGGIYISTYQSGSSLQYNELIVSAGLVRYSGQWGGWISHIYVDDENSVAGGREIWGLPKELAEFKWEGHNRVTVSQGKNILCRLTYTQPSLSLPLSLTVPAFGYQQGRILHFQNHFKCNVSLISGQVEIPSESPFYPLNLNHPWFTLYQNALNLVVDQPRSLE